MHIFICLYIHIFGDIYYLYTNRSVSSNLSSALRSGQCKSNLHSPGFVSFLRVFKKASVSAAAGDRPGEFSFLGLCGFRGAPLPRENGKAFPNLCSALYIYVSRDFERKIMSTPFACGGVSPMRSGIGTATLCCQRAQRPSRSPGERQRDDRRRGSRHLAENDSPSIATHL